MLLPESRPTRWDLHWRMFGSELRIRPVFWASCVLLGLIVFRDPDIGGMGMFWFWIVAVLISLLAHETCHFLAARLFGASIRVVLSGLGGQVHGLDERKRWQRVLILLAGPLGNLLLSVALWVIADPQWNPLPIYRLGADWTIFLVNAVKIAWLFNVFWVLLNVLPLWPLDGGRIAVEIGEALLGRYGRIAALLVSLAACLLLSLTVVCWARLGLTDRFDPRYALSLFYFLILSLYCYFFWISAFRALWGDPVPLDESSKAGRAA
ncbi:MAG TPA: M50 family metallopeptidase [Gemmataceae bacterium]|nr:M50 family metallopeptidase [Gemmataceae bacterium]